MLRDLPVFERHNDGYTLSTDRARLDPAAIHAFLRHESYWARGIALPQFERALAGSLPIGIFAPDGSMAAFGRVVTDFAVFAYLRDIFTLLPHRGRGLAVWLATAIREHPELATVTSWMLATRDAHSVYARAGFRPVPHPEYYMSLPKPGERT
jgi:GNAT superfamily N-acetyltransferase